MPLLLKWFLLPAPGNGVFCLGFMEEHSQGNCEVSGMGQVSSFCFKKLKD